MEHTRKRSSLAKSSQLTPNKLKQLYAAMHRYKAFARNSSTHDEAIYVGIGLELEKRDFIAWEPGTGPQYLPVKDLSILPNVSSEITTGVALASKLHHLGPLVLAFTTTPPEQSKSALLLAAEHKLPIIYVQKNAPLSTNVVSNATYGFPVMTVDANDAVAIYRVAQEAIYRARIGGGPTLVACCRLEEKDPLAYMQHYLEKKGLWSAVWKTKLDKALAQQFRSGGV
jgi:hypothetical protein